MTSVIDSPYKGSGQLTRQQFLFYEMRTTAKLMIEGMDDSQILNHIVSENLYQYPTEKTIKQIALGCIARLKGLNDERLVSEIANGDIETAKQCCLYAMMKQFRLVWDFMITVIGEKYRVQDFSFNRSEILMFFLRIQEQDDLVASWSESTVKKIVSVIMRILIETDYLDNNKAATINTVLINRTLEDAIRSSGDTNALVAFNCLA